MFPVDMVQDPRPVWKDEFIADSVSFNPATECKLKVAKYEFHYSISTWFWSPFNQGGQYIWIWNPDGS